MRIEDICKERIILFDGAMGTMLQAAGLKGGELPEVYNLTHPEILIDIHRQYLEAGADIITTNTLGANRQNLEPLGLKPEKVIHAAVGLARTAGAGIVALDIGPVGQLMAPMGTLTFEAAYELFAQQAKAGEAAGADLVLIETLTDLYEAKAAVLAVKENTKLPVICTMTFEQNGRTLMGTDPFTAVTVLEGLGVDALGINCSLGPDELMPIALEFIQAAHVPVLIQPNAGLPRIVDGRTDYPATEAGFSTTVKGMVEAGASMVGGCCGTNPAFIRAIYREVSPLSPNRVLHPIKTSVASARTTILFGDGFKVIGERINPSGKRQLTQAIFEKNLDVLLSEGSLQRRAGADILDINVFVEGTDELAMMVDTVTYLQSMLPIPMQLDSINAAPLAAAARIYNGKPLLNSVCYTQKSLDGILPIAKKYGACMIGLTMDEQGVPDTANERLSIARRLLEAVEDYGIPRENLLIDCLVQSAGSGGNPMETLKAVTLVKTELGLKTVLGISNVSYGHPSRPDINRIYLAMALSAGLDAAILDPTSDAVIDAIRIHKMLLSGITKG